LSYLAWKAPSSECQEECERESCPHKKVTKKGRIYWMAVEHPVRCPLYEELALTLRCSHVEGVLNRWHEPAWDLKGDNCPVDITSGGKTLDAIPLGGLRTIEARVEVEKRLVRLEEKEFEVVRARYLNGEAVSDKKAREKVGLKLSTFTNLRWEAIERIAR